MPEPEATNAIIRELLASPIDEFTTKRNARVKELRAAGNRALASDIQKLRRPSLPLWAANQLARQQPELLTRVREAATAAADAQARGSAGDLRDALARLQPALDAAAGAAGALLRSAGHTLTADASLHLRNLVRVAAVRGGDDWQALADGALMQEPAPDLGFGTLPVAPPASEPPPVEATPPPQDEAQERLRNERERALHDARRRAADDARAAAQVLRRAKRSREQADDLAERAREAERRAAEAERVAAEAQEQASAARATVEELEGDLDRP